MRLCKRSYLTQLAYSLESAVRKSEWRGVSVDYKSVWINASHDTLLFRRVADDTSNIWEVDYCHRPSGLFLLLL